MLLSIFMVWGIRQRAWYFHDERRRTGISILPSYVTSKLKDADNLVFIPLVGEFEYEEIIAVWKEDNQDQALRRFVPRIS